MMSRIICLTLNQTKFYHQRYLNNNKYTNTQYKPGWRMSDSGKSSKFDVSSILLISIEMAAGRSLCVETGNVNVCFWQNVLQKQKFSDSQTWCAPSPQTQRTDDSWSHPHSLLQSCSRHRRSTFNLQQVFRKHSLISSNRRSMPSQSLVD